MNPETLSPEDYTDPTCPFCVDQYAKEPPVRAIEQDRVLAKLDEILSHNDYQAAERHLLYWLAEAVDGHDLRGEFMIQNELMGLYRKLGREEDSLFRAEEALRLTDALGIGEEIGGATAYVNKATALKAFGRAEESIPLFKRAKRIYENAKFVNQYRLGGLYNNMALSLVDVGRYAEARELYEKAFAVMKNVEGGEPETAVTWLNLANLEEAEKGLEAADSAIADCIEKAYALLDTPGLPRDGNYAFVCEKCVPTFSYYGYFFYAKELSERARAIYERS